MVKQELIDRSPVRFFENALDGGLKDGEIGVLTSKKGLGKTSILVQIGLDMLLQGKQVIHVSFNQHCDYVITWYENIFAEMAKKKNLSKANEVKDELIRKRIVLNFNQDTVSTEQIVKTLKALAVGGIKTDCLIIDGFDFDRASAKDIELVKNFAKEENLSVWYSSNSDSGELKAVVDECIEKFIDVVIYLESKNDGILPKILKLRSNGSVDANLKLDAKTLLIAER